MDVIFAFAFNCYGIMESEERLFFFIDCELHFNEHDTRSNILKNHKTC